jgi:hypothetical protein
MFEIQLIIIMEYDLVHEDFEVFFPFQNMIMHDFCIEQFTKLCPLNW